jgi:hypothetical protein
LSEPPAGGHEIIDGMGKVARFQPFKTREEALEAAGLRQ